MLRAIREFAVGVAKGLARALRATAKTVLEMLDEMKAMLMSPLNALAPKVSHMPPAHFEPEVAPEALLNDLRQQAGRTAAIREADRDTYRTVTSYLKAHASSRMSFDLRDVPKDVRATLLTMSDYSRKALAEAGPGAIKKFIAGKDSGVPGIPVVRPVAAVPKSEKEVTPYDLLVERIRKGLTDQRSVPYAMPKM